MKYFTIKELCKSSTAEQKKINNSPNEKIINNLEMLVDNILDPLREKYGKPIRVNSGYRSSVLNKLIGGSTHSQHMDGLAADITAGSILENRRLFVMVQEMNLPFDQLIDENNYKYIHVSFSKNPRKQILHL